LNASEDDEERGAGTGRSGEEIFEREFARLDQGGYALGMLGVGDAFKETVGGAEDGEADVWAADEGCEAFAMAFAGFAEEDGCDAAGGAESFFDEARAFDADGTLIGGKAAAESDAELLEPAIVAAGKEVGGSGGFGRSGHWRKVSKNAGGKAMGAGGYQRSEISDQEARKSKTKDNAPSKLRARRRRERVGAQREEEPKSTVRSDCATGKRDPRPR
jgi:hypothetical protein